MTLFIRVFLEKRVDRISKRCYHEIKNKKKGIS